MCLCMRRCIPVSLSPLAFLAKTKAMVSILTPTSTHTGLGVQVVVLLRSSSSTTTSSTTTDHHIPPVRRACVEHTFRPRPSRFLLFPSLLPPELGFFFLLRGELVVCVCMCVCLLMRWMMRVSVLPVSSPLSSWTTPPKRMRVESAAA